MVVGPLRATTLNTLVSTPHGLRANLVLSKVDATSSIGDVSKPEKPEEIHFLGITGDLPPRIPAGGNTNEGGILLPFSSLALDASKRNSPQ